MIRAIIGTVLGVVLGVMVGCANGADGASEQSDRTSGSRTVESSHPLVKAARLQLKNPAKYSGKYYAIEYPDGDIPADRGACTDVVVRALREFDLDLQELIQIDADEAFYPRMRVRDRNIDHRRCPNQMMYFSRHAETVEFQSDGLGIEPGDIVFWKLRDGRDHVGIASDRKGKSGKWQVIHNIGPEVIEADVLTEWEIVGVFRLKSDDLAGN